MKKCMFVFALFSYSASDVFAIIVDELLQLFASVTIGVINDLNGLARLRLVQLKFNVAARSESE